MLTQEDLNILRSRFHVEKSKLRSHGIEFDIADIMGVIEDYNQEVINERGTERA